MAHYVALGIVSADSGTWISTMAIQARQIVGAVRITYTLWFAVWRTSDKVGQTRARMRVTSDFAPRIGATRRRLARVNINILFWWPFNYSMVIKNLEN